MTKPKFAILLLTYNQENYINRCIESILNQSYENFEIFVGDDSSTDSTFKVAKSFKDSRIKVAKTPYNMGINANLNLVYDLAVKTRSDYFVFIAGDDKLRKNYLQTIAENFAKKPSVDVLYSHLCVIDENDKYTFGEDVPYVSCENETREAKIHTAFMLGNIFVSPGMAMRKKVAQKIFPLPYSIVNYQDYAMHCEILVAGFGYFVLDEILVDYRQFNDGRNISYGGENNNGTLLREQMEVNFLMDIFLKIKDISLLERIFQKEIKDTKIKPFKDTIPFFLGQMAMCSPVLKRREWGYQAVLKFLSDKRNYDLAHKRYDFCFKDYLNLVKCLVINNENNEFDKILIDRDRFRKKYKKYKKIFKISLVIICVLLAIISVNLKMT